MFANSAGLRLHGDRRAPTLLFLGVYLSLSGHFGSGGLRAKLDWRCGAFVGVDVARRVACLPPVL